MYTVDDLVSVFVHKQDGEHIASLVDNGTRVMMHIVLGPTQASPAGNVNRTSVLFVSISFIVLMVISLAWLVFYYIQRFRYAHTKDRLAVRYVFCCYCRHCKITQYNDNDTQSSYRSHAVYHSCRPLMYRVNQKTIPCSLYCSVNTC